MIKGDLLQKLLKYTRWLEGYQLQLEGVESAERIPDNSELELICESVDKCTDCCVLTEANNPAVLKLIRLNADVRQLMSQRG